MSGTNEILSAYPKQEDLYGAPLLTWWTFFQE